MITSCLTGSCLIKALGTPGPQATSCKVGMKSSEPKVLVRPGVSFYRLSRVSSTFTGHTRDRFGAPGGAGTHTGHTGAHGHTDHTDEPHNRCYGTVPLLRPAHLT
jgi:hypothetical protein